MPQLHLFADTRVGEALALDEEMTALRFDSGAGLLQRGLGLINKTNKQISQLIARAWLEHNPDLVNENAIIDLVVANKLISEGDRRKVVVVIDREPYSKWSDAGASESYKPNLVPPEENYVGYWAFFENPQIPGPHKLVTNMYVPFPERPQEVSEKTLSLWVEQNPARPPFYPDPALGLPQDAIWIPYSC